MRGYSEAEFRRVLAAARAIVGRVRAGREVLEQWRSGHLSKDSDPHRWELGELLDHVERHGEVPHRVRGGRRFYDARTVKRHGGVSDLIGRNWRSRRNGHRPI
jgi:hypothetical protein